MNLDDFIIACFCMIDDQLPIVLNGTRLHRRGPAPKLSDSEVVTMEVVGAFLGITQDQALYNYFRRHYAHFFPAFAYLHRTTFVRQAANLWAVKERLWCHMRDELLRYDPGMAILDSLPLPVCRFARSSRCVRFWGMAAYGKDHSGKQTFYGFRLHLRLCWPGVITQMFLAPANEQDFEIAPVLGRVRYLVDTVFGQVTDRCGIKRVWAHDLWHLRNRVLRAVLMHTLGFWFNQQDEAPRLQLERLVA